MVVVDDEVIRHVSRGLALDRIPLGVTGDGPWGLIDANERLLAVYEATDTDRIRPAVVLESGADPWMSGRAVVWWRGLHTGHLPPPRHRCGRNRTTRR